MGPFASIILIDGLRCVSVREVPRKVLAGPDSKDATLNLEVASERALGGLFISLSLAGLSAVGSPEATSLPASSVGLGRAWGLGFSPPWWFRGGEGGQPCQGHSCPCGHRGWGTMGACSPSEPGPEGPCLASFRGQFLAGRPGVGHRTLRGPGWPPSSLFCPCSVSAPPWVGWHVGLRSRAALTFKPAESSGPCLSPHPSQRGQLQGQAV